MVLPSPPARKLLLTTHVLSSVGWAGALAMFLAHALGAMWTTDPALARALALAMALGAWWVILPLSIVSLATGIAEALVSAWGVLRHYWVVFKLILTVLATGVLLLKMSPISFLAEQAAAQTQDDLSGLRLSLALHAAGGLVVLLATTVLAIWKPNGLTRWGTLAAHRAREPVPRWVKVTLALTALMGLLLGFMLALGRHGPSAHVTR